jgi:hypothetical protein
MTSLRRMLVPGLFAKPEMEPVSNYVPEAPLSSLRGCHEDPKLRRFSDAGITEPSSPRGELDCLVSFRVVR